MSNRFLNKRRELIKERFREPPISLAVFREMLKLTSLSVSYGMFSTPQLLFRECLRASPLDHPTSQKRRREIVARWLLEYLDKIGPVYGKAIQTYFSGSEENTFSAELSAQVNSQWPAIPYRKVLKILDNEVPTWRDHFSISGAPLGVGSMAQVHEAIDQEGKEWVLKIVKPSAKRRLLETVAALKQVIKTLKAVDQLGQLKQGLKQAENLIASIEMEHSMLAERNNILKVRAKMTERKLETLYIPKVHETLYSDSVLTMEKVSGTPLSEVTASGTVLPYNQRKKLARKMLSDLLIQTFDIGVFHGDPHSGNLILTDDGSLALVDWGLTGELIDMDRQLISGLLQAIIHKEPEKLVQCLRELAREEGIELEEEKIIHQLQELDSLLREKQYELSLKQVLELAVSAADNLGVELPSGLLLVAKTLLTVEAVAKGMDPDLSLRKEARGLIFRMGPKKVFDMMGWNKLSKFTAILKKQASA